MTTENQTFPTAEDVARAHTNKAFALLQAAIGKLFGSMQGESIDPVELRRATGDTSSAFKALQKANIELKGE